MAREIEFLAGPESENVPPPAAPPRSRPPLLWTVLAALAVVAAATWIAVRPTPSTHSSARPTHTVTARPSVTASKPTPAPTSTVRMCMAGRPINAQLLRLSRHNLPGLTLVPAESFTCSMGAGTHRVVVSESIAVRWHSLVVEIQASRRVGDGGQYLPAPRQRALISLVSAESQSAGLNVLVEAYGRSNTKVQAISLSNLASDLSLQLIL